MGRKHIDPNGRTDVLPAYVTQAQGNWLRKRAHDRGKSYSFVIRELIDERMMIEKAMLEQERSHKPKET
jgi:hypothetical protein